MPVDQQRLGVRQGAASSRALLRNGWKCFEAPGVEPVFLDQEQAIDYAKSRACFRSGEIRVLQIKRVQSSVSFPSAKQIESCNAASPDSAGGTIVLSCQAAVLFGK